MNRLHKIKIFWFPPLFWFFPDSIDGMVLSKNIIWVRFKEDKKLFKSHLRDMKKHKGNWKTRENVKFFLHELCHTIQSWNIPFWTRMKIVFRGIKKDHDNRMLEIQADDFAKKYRKSPKEAIDGYLKMMREYA